MGRTPRKRNGLFAILGLIALAYAACIAAMARVTAQDILRPKRWHPNERWPGVPYCDSPSAVPCDLPVSTFQTRLGLKVVGPVTPGHPSPLQPGDLIRSIAGIPTSPVHGLRLARFLASLEAGTTVPMCISRTDASGAREVEIAVELPPAVLDPSNLGLPFEDVTLRGVSGAAIRGWYVPPPSRHDRHAPALVYVHGRQRNRRHFGLTDLACPAHARGYGLLLIDLLGSGDSDGSVDFWGNDEVGLAMRYLAARPEIDPDRIGIVGVSFGGIKALQAAGDPSLKVGALAILSAADTTPRYIRLVAPPDGLPEYLRRRLMCGLTLPAWLVESGRPLVNWWFRRATGRCLSEVDPARSAARATCPVFLAHGTADRTFSPDAARRIFAMIPTPKVYYPVVGHDHFSAVQAGEPLHRNLFAFLDEYLVPGKVTPNRLRKRPTPGSTESAPLIELADDQELEFSSPAAD